MDRSKDLSRLGLLVSAPISSERSPRRVLMGEERKRVIGLYEAALANHPHVKKAA